MIFHYFYIGHQSRVKEFVMQMSKANAFLNIRQKSELLLIKCYLYNRFIIFSAENMSFTHGLTLCCVLKCHQYQQEYNLFSTKENIKTGTLLLLWF